MLTREEERQLDLLLQANPETVEPAGVRLLQRYALLTRWPAAAAAADAVMGIHGRPLEAIPLRDPQLVMRAGVPAILEAVTKAYGFTLEQLRSPSRARRVSRARHVAAWLARRLTHLPLTEIAHQVGRRDHTTVIHGLHVLDAELVRDPQLRASMQQLLADLTRPIPAAALEGGTAATATAVRMQDGGRP